MLTRYIPSQTDVAAYQSDGFWISPPIIDPQRLVLLRERFYNVLNGTFATGIAPYKYKKPENLAGVVKLTNTLWSDAVLARLMLHPYIGEIITTLTNQPSWRYWRDHLWYKAPQSGSKGNVGWHQDYYYWQCAEPAQLVTAWIALDDVPLEAGCLEYVRGSHKWGLLGEGDLYDQRMEYLQQRIEQASHQPFNTVKCVMPAGSISIHHCLIIHGSNANYSTVPRLSLSVHYFPDGTIYRKGRGIKPFSNETLFDGNDGEPFAGIHFPLLYSKNGMHNVWQ